MGIVDKHDSDAPQIVDRAINQLWDIVSDLTKIRTDTPYFRVTIFGSARIKPEEPLYQDVKHLAARLSGKGMDIVTGGGPGLMQAANEGENVGDPENRTRSIGIRVALPFEQGANAFVEKLYTHRTFFSRLQQFMRLSNAFIVVGGGIGTTLELMMVWQLLQVRHASDVPLILVGPMWRELVEWAKRYMLIEPTALASAADLAIPICVETVDEAAELVEARFAAFGVTSAPTPTPTP